MVECVTIFFTQNEDNLNNEDDLKKKTILFFGHYSVGLGNVLTNAAMGPFLISWVENGRSSTNFFSDILCVLLVVIKFLETK